MRLARRPYARRALVSLLAAASLAALPVAGASARPLAEAHVSGGARTCGPAYVHAYLSWGEKCLRAGEFCKIGNREYLRYGFVCPANGHLRRR
jgi:hypothetical protein